MSVEKEADEFACRYKEAEMSCVAFKAYLAGHAAAQRWIRVTEAIPQLHQEVLAYGNGYCNVAWIVPFGEWKDPEENGYYEGQFVTAYSHWQPLPPAPSEGE